MGGAVPPPPAPPPLGAPVPPPPPPIIQGGGPPPPPPTAGRGDLLSQIQSGTTLKKVDPNEKPSGGGDGRNSLLSDIRTGVKLRTVSVFRPLWGFSLLSDKEVYSCVFGVVKLCYTSHINQKT